MKKLGFIHITKCAGTSKEDMGNQDKQKWGRFDKEYGFHHRLFNKVPKSVRQSKDWFAVVRNPYDRILSEYYCKYGGINNPTLKNKPNHNKQGFNEYIRNKINKRSKIGNHYTEQYKYFEGVPETKVQVIKMEKAVAMNNPPMSVGGGCKSNGLNNLGGFNVENEKRVIKNLQSVILNT